MSFFSRWNDDSDTEKRNRDTTALFDSLALGAHSGGLRCRTRRCSRDAIVCIAAPDGPPSPHCGQHAADVLATTPHAREYPLSAFNSPEGPIASFSSPIDGDGGKWSELATDTDDPEQWVLAQIGDCSVVDLGGMC